MKHIAAMVAAYLLVLFRLHHEASYWKKVVIEQCQKSESSQACLSARNHQQAAQKEFREALARRK